MYEQDKRIVMTLDAGGTNFVFSAIQGCKEIISPIGIPAVADNLEGCLLTLVEGFEQVKKLLPEPPVAISFAFPGPADYKNGIIGDLPNFPAFRGGVALGPSVHFVRTQWSHQYRSPPRDIGAVSAALKGYSPEFLLLSLQQSLIVTVIYHPCLYHLMEYQAAFLIPLVMSCCQLPSKKGRLFVHLFCIPFC